MEQQEETQEKLLVSITKSDYEEVRIRESLFKGKEYVDIRVFSKNKRGEFIPTKKGVTFTKDIMKKIQEAFKNIDL